MEKRNEVSRQRYFVFRSFCYGRLLAYVFVDGKNLNIDLVRQGLSPYYTKYGKSQKYDHAFRSAEKLARKEKLNIWGDPDLTQKYLRLKSKWGQAVLIK